MAHVANHTKPLLKEGYSNGTISAHEEYISGPFDGVYPPLSRDRQSRPQVEPPHQAQSPKSPLLSLSPSPRLEPPSGAQPPMPSTCFPSLVGENSIGSACRNHPTRSAPRDARILRRSLIRAGKFKSLLGRNSDRDSLHHSDRSRRLQDARNRLTRLSHSRTRLQRRRQGSLNHPTRAAEYPKSRTVLCPEAERWASQYMRRKPASKPRENTPLQPSNQATGSDSELDRDTRDAHDASWNKGKEAIDRAETSLLANHEPGQFHVQSNVALQYASRSPELATASPSFFPDIDVDELYSPRSPDVTTASPSFFPDIDIGEGFSSRSPAVAAASSSLFPDLELGGFNQQISSDVNARHHYQAGIENSPVLSFAGDRYLSDWLSHIADHNAEPGLARESSSHGAPEDMPRHESENSSTRDSDNTIINQRSRPTAAQINNFQHSSSMSRQVQSSESFGEGSHFLYDTFPWGTPLSSFNNLHAEVASTRIPSSEGSIQLAEQDKISDDESEGTILGDAVEIDGVWNRIEHLETDLMF